MYTVESSYFTSSVIAELPRIIKLALHCKNLISIVVLVEFKTENHMDTLSFTSTTAMHNST